MKFRVLWRSNGGSRMISRARCNRRLSSASIASLGLALAWFCGSSLAHSQVQAEDRGQNVRYTIQDLGVVGTNLNQPGQPFVISNSGWVSGGAGVGTAEHAVLWHGRKMYDIGNPGLGGNSISFGVNLLGLAVGEAEDDAADLSTTEDFCGFQAMGYSSSPTPCVPFIWSNGRMYPLKTLGGMNGVANQINLFGAVAGYAENKTEDPGCPAPQIYQFKPVVWFGDRIQQLPTVKDDDDGVALSINDLGQVVGASGTCAPFNSIFLTSLLPAHALLWQNGRAQDLGNLGGTMNNIAEGVNNRGQVVGGSDLAGDQTSHAFLWTAATKMQDLGTVEDEVDNDSYSVGIGINDKGQIVGISASADFSILRGFIRQNGKLVDLNSLVAGSTSLNLLTACSINLAGEIIGIAFDPNTGDTHAYKATPTAEAAAYKSDARKPVILPDWVRTRLRFVKPM
jgi:probable HAF family extracellular repeat protein